VGRESKTKRGSKGRRSEGGPRAHKRGTGDADLDRSIAARRRNESISDPVPHEGDPDAAADGATPHPSRPTSAAKRPTSSDRPRSAARAKAPGRIGGGAKRDAAEIRPASPTE